jgi:enoyl-CoA hydratase
MYKNLHFEVRDQVAFVTVNRPNLLNALDRTTLSALGEAFEAISCDDTVRVAILTGEGEKAFVAGADIQELAELSASEGEAYSRFGQGIFDSIQNLGKPTIAAVNGYALGGGCELAMACSVRIASQNATFGQPEVGLGLIPGFGGTQRLPRLVGPGRALELLLSGTSIDAQEAARIGLVNSVVSPDQLMPTAEALARKIAANGAYAVGQVLRAVNAGMETSQADGQSMESRSFGATCDTDEMRTRTEAFLNRTKK